MKKLLLSLMLLLPVMAVSGSVISRSNVGDTVQCEISSKKDGSFYDDFILKGKRLQFTRIGEEDYYAVIDSRNDSISVVSIYERASHRHVATGDYLLTDSLKRHGVWKWFGENEQMLFLEQYQAGYMYAVESFVYDPEGGLMYSNYYSRRKKGQKNAIRLDKVYIYYPSGQTQAIASIPKERTKNNSRGGLTVNPTAVVYYDTNGNEIQFGNAKGVQNMVTKYIQKNFQCPRMENAWVATASFDVIVRTDITGKIHLVHASDDVFYHYTMMDYPASGELKSKITPALQAFIHNELPSMELAGKPVTVAKKTVEAVLYLTITIRIKTQI